MFTYILILLSCVEAKCRGTYVEAYSGCHSNVFQI